MYKAFCISRDGVKFRSDESASFGSADEKISNEKNLGGGVRKKWACQISIAHSLSLIEAGGPGLHLLLLV